MEVQDRINKWRLKKLRWEHQVNDDVCLLWYNEWLDKFEKELLDYASWQLNVSDRVSNIIWGQSDYQCLPIWQTNIEDFYSIIQLRVAYRTDKNWIPVYRVCKQINLWDYNIRPQWTHYEWYQKWEPLLKQRISKRFPRFAFLNKNTIRIFPTPDENVSFWLNITYNYIEKEVSLHTDEDDLNLPYYFFDVIEDYLTYNLILNENPELAPQFYQEWIDNIHNNIYGLNRDQRTVEEEFADLSYYYTN